MKPPNQSFAIALHLLRSDFWPIKFYKMLTKSIVLFVVVGLILPLNVSGQVKDISTDRPDQSNTPLLIPQGALQIETGFLVETENKLLTHQRNYTYNNTLLKFGINEYFELRLNTLYQGSITTSDVKPIHGFGPLSVGMKIKLSEGKGMLPKASLITHINLRSGTIDFRPSYISSDITLACSHDLNDRCTITYNGGVKWNGESPEAIALYALSLAYTITTRVALFTESYAFFQERHKPDHRADAGITYKLAPQIQYDLSGGIGLTKNAPDYFISTGLSIRLFK